jgi:hypothetical protein
MVDVGEEQMPAVIAPERIQAHQRLVAIPGSQQATLLPRINPFQSFGD